MPKPTLTPEPFPLEDDAAAFLEEPETTDEAATSEAAQEAPAADPATKPKKPPYIEDPLFVSKVEAMRAKFPIPTPEQVAHIAPELRSHAVPLSSFEFNADNYQLHPPEQIDLIRHSFREYQQRQVLVVNVKFDEDGNPHSQVLEAGEGRTIAAQQEGYEYISVLYVQDDPSKAAGYAIVDNRSAEFAEIDDAKLLVLINRYLEDDTNEVTDTGYDAGELALLRSIQAGGDDADNEENKEGGQKKDDEFQAFTPDEKFAHKCPSCGFQFND